MSCRPARFGTQVKNSFRSVDCALMSTGEVTRLGLVGVNYEEVKRLRQLAGLLALSLTLGSPLMACLVSGAEMNAAERECCKQMAKRCGSMEMPSSHSCCQTEVRQAGPMLHVELAHVAPHILVMAAHTPVMGAVHSLHASNADRHPPPESPPGSSSIMRI